MNTRRDFIKKGFAVGALFSLADLGGLFAADAQPGKQPPKGNRELATGNDGKPLLVAVRDGDRVTMLNRATAALGGMAAFVKKGQTVVIKPNIGWDVPPERAANTHPEIVGRLVEMCLAAGAKEVSVFDHTCHPWEKAYANSGIEKAVKTAGGKMIAGHDKALYRSIKIPGAQKLKTALVHSAIIDADVFINAPVLKHHGGATMTACMKNYMGLVWDRGYFHKNDLHACIADIVRYRRPALNVLDAYTPMMRNGPQGKSTDDLLAGIKTLLVSTDIVACDAAGAKILGHKQDGIKHVKLAGDAGFGTYELDKIKIERIKIA